MRKPHFLLAACLVFLSTFGVYLFTSIPSIAEDDSGELTAVGATLGTAHPPGYPLYSILGKICVTAVPWGNKAYRVNLVSSLFIAATCCLIFLLAFESGMSLPAGLFLSFMFSFSPLVWAMANTTEVYGLTAFFACALTWLLLRYSTQENAQYHFFAFYCAAAYLFAVGMTTHYTIGLLLPGLLLWLWLNGRHSLRSSWPSYLAAGLAFAALGASMMLFIYVRGKTNPLLGWEDPGTLQRFWQVIARLRYGSFALAQGGAPPLELSMIGAKIIFFFTVLKENLTVPGFLIFIAGAGLSFREKKTGWVLLAFLIASGPGFLILANTGLGAGSAALLKRFFFLPLLFSVLS